jgi:hypothetical protein
VKTKPRRIWLLGIGAAAIVAGAVVSTHVGRHSDSARPAAGQGPGIDVYKDATCGCCNKWVEHLRTHGLEVRVTNTLELAGFKANHGVPRQVQSCHTAIVEGYVIEGHVPASDVQRLLKERPPIAGLAVGGMPVGSPGMEMPGAKAEPYDVMAFDTSGATRVFASHR